MKIQRLSLLLLSSVFFASIAQAGITHMTYEGDGRRSAKAFKAVMEERSIPVVKEFYWDLSAVRAALKTNASYLKKIRRRGTVGLGDGKIAVSALQRANDIVSRGLAHSAFPVGELQFLQLKGTDGRGNVLFTGYCSPTIEAARVRSSEFRYPLHRRPQKGQFGNGALPTRGEILDGALDGRGLELAWARDYFDLYILQTQGSGFVRYPDGEKDFFAYGGRNNRGRKSPGKHLIALGEIQKKDLSVAAMRKWFAEHPARVEEILQVDPAYLFFRSAPADPRGASDQSLTPGVSVAVDTAIVPFGAMLLIEEPVLDNKRNVTGYRLRLAVAQDRGASIKGPGRIDLYTGWSDKAVRRAGNLHQYGRAWVVLPKD